MPLKTEVFRSCGSELPRPLIWGGDSLGRENLRDLRGSSRRVNRIGVRACPCDPRLPPNEAINALFSTGFPSWQTTPDTSDWQPVLSRSLYSR